MDPQVRMALLQQLMQPQRTSSPGAAILQGLTRMLAAKGYSNASQQLADAQAQKDQEEKQALIDSLTQAGMDPAKAAAVAEAPSSLQSVLASQYMKAQPQPTWEDAVDPGTLAVMEDTDLGNLSDANKAQVIAAINDRANLASGQAGPPRPITAQMLREEKKKSSVDELADLLATQARHDHVLKHGPGAAEGTTTDEKTGKVTSQATTASVTLAQRRIAEVDEQLEKLKTVSMEAAKEHLDIAGRAMDKGASIAAYGGRITEALAPDLYEKSASRVKEMQTLHNSVEQLFNVYRKLITGAAASVLELGQLRKAYINMDMSYPAFEAGWNVIEDNLQTVRKQFEGYLNEGYRLHSSEEKAIEHARKAFFEAIGADPSDPNFSPESDPVVQSYFSGQIRTPADEDRIGNELGRKLFEDEDDDDPLGWRK